MLLNSIEVESYAVKFAWNSVDKSLLIFLDFAAAFPSIARLFLWKALCAIGVPQRIIKAIMALYTNNIHFIRTNSGLLFVFVVYSGVRQGCPLSSVVFVLTTDCINMYLNKRLGDRDKLWSYADDIAALLYNYKYSLDQLCNALNVIGSVSALNINCSKCVCIPLWPGSLEEIQSSVCSEFPGVSNFSFAWSAKYLGFYIGPGANGLEWTKIEKSIVDLGLLVKSLGLPKLQAFILFNMLAMSKLAFPAQLRKPPSSIVICVRETQKKLCGGGASWSPTNFLHFLNRDGGFPIDLKHADSLCKAVALRTFYSFRAEIANGNSIACSGEGLVDSALVFPFPNWISQCAFNFLGKNFESFDEKGFLENSICKGLSIQDLKDRKLLQNRMYTHIRDSFVPFSMVRALEERFALRNWWSGAMLSAHAVAATKLVLDLKGVVPPCIQFCYLKTLFNGWPTAARFQERDGKNNRCMLCCDCNGEDSLEHYGCCNYGWRFFGKQFNCSVFPMSLERFLGFNASSFKMQVTHVIHVYAVYSLSNLRRFRNEFGNENVLDKALSHFHKQAIMIKSSLSLYSEIFQSSLGVP